MLPEILLEDSAEERQFSDSILECMDVARLEQVMQEKQELGVWNVGARVVSLINMMRTIHY
eukprot:57721-Amphidinium_carterae.1